MVKDYSWQERFVEQFTLSEFLYYYLSAVTGSGKSRAKIKAILRHHNLNPSAAISLILVNTTNVTKQHCNTAVELGFKPLYTIGGTINVYRNDEGVHIAYATWQAVNLLCKKIEDGRSANPFEGLGVLVIDEVHNGASGDGSSIKRIEEVLHPQRRLYVSATLQGVNEKLFGEKTPETVFRFTRKQAIKAGLLCPVEFRFIQSGLSLDIATLRGLKDAKIKVESLEKSEGDDLVKQFDLLREKGVEMNADTFNELRHGRVAAATDAYMDRHFGQKAIVFCPTVEAARNGAERANLKFGHKYIEGKPFHYARAVDCSRPNAAYIINDFKNGDMAVIYVVGMMQEGFDMPELRIGFDCRFNISTSPKVIARIIQREGRLMRAFEGKPDGLYYIFLDVSHLMVAGKVLKSQSGVDLTGDPLAASYMASLIDSHLDSGGFEDEAFTLKDVEVYGSGDPIKGDSNDETKGDEGPSVGGDDVAGNAGAANDDAPDAPGGPTAGNGEPDPNPEPTDEEDEYRIIRIVDRAQGYRDLGVKPMTQKEYEAAENSSSITEEELEVWVDEMIERVLSGNPMPKARQSDGTFSRDYRMKAKAVNHPVLGPKLKNAVWGAGSNWIIKTKRKPTEGRRSPRTTREAQIHILRQTIALAQSGAPKPKDDRDIRAIKERTFGSKAPEVREECIAAMVNAGWYAAA